MNTDTPTTTHLLVRRLPIDWRSMSKETGCTRGTLCHHAVFGWGIQNGNGDADFCCVTAPVVAPGETLRVEKGMWVVYAPRPSNTEATDAKRSV